MFVTAGQHVGFQHTELYMEISGLQWVFWSNRLQRDTDHLPAGWTRRTAATDQEGGGGASLHDDRVTGATSDCCFLCTIIPNTWIILTPKISNCPFDESSHLCKVTCRMFQSTVSVFATSCHTTRNTRAPLLSFFTRHFLLWHQPPIWSGHIGRCICRVAGKARVLPVDHEIRHESDSTSLFGLVLSHSSKNKLESGGRVSLSSDSQPGPSVWAHQRVKIL